MATGYLPKKFLYCVAIDFGTDGTCWYLSDGSKYYMQEKGIHGFKDQTNILLNKSLKFVGFGRHAQEMYLKNPKYKDYYYFERFKMQLHNQEMLKYQNNKNSDTKEDENNDKTSYLKATNGKLVKTNIVLTQALIYLKNEITGFMEDMDIIFNDCDIKWIITVPGIWSEAGRNIMHKAANDACMTLKSIPNHMEIVSEPICILLSFHNQAKLKIGSKYILLDLGGSAANICCHQLYQNNNVKIIRYSVVNVGKWGAAYIDEAFIDLVSEIFKLGSKNIINEFMNINPIKLLQFKESFRDVKHSFKGTENNHLFIKMPEALETFILEKHGLITSKEPGSTPDEGDSDDDDDSDSDEEEDISSTKLNDLIQQKIKNGLSKKYSTIKKGYIQYKDGCLYIDRYVMKILFNTILVPLIEHIDNDLLKDKNLKDCKTIFLAGGLSSSSYANDTITNHYKSKNISVYSVCRPSKAVVEGAVKIGFNPSSIIEC